MVVVTGAGTGHGTNTIEGKIMTRSLNELIETFYRGFSGDTALFDDVVTPDWDDIPLGPDQAPGRDGIKPLVTAINRAFADFKIVVHTIVDGRADNGNGLVAVRAEICGTHDGDWFGVPATGQQVRIRIHEFHEVIDGRMVRTWHLEDWLGWFQQVGAWPTVGNEEK
ncbi:ester cyclase [Nocardia sp. NPDC005998]|uniref:ester cyclase n=1 Tax=Nocardia sp. NPDC005998 TaxID=3156894 RepID=UPI0033ADA1AC